MRFIPRLVASFRVQANAARAPDSPHTTGGPIVQRWPHRRLVVIRADDELLAYDLDRLTAGDGAPAARFPAPWPRRAGGPDAAGEADAGRRSAGSARGPGGARRSAPPQA